VVCVDAVADDAVQCSNWIRGRGGETLAVTADVTDELRVEAMVAGAREAFGGVDVLLANAGILGPESVVDMPLPRWTRQIGVNLTGTVLGTEHVARHMVESARGGSIIVIVPAAGHQGQAGNIAYSTSKGGLLNFTRADAADLARHGIRVNSLTPTATDQEEGIERAVAWGGRARSAVAARSIRADGAGGPAAEPAPRRAPRCSSSRTTRSDHRDRPACRRRRRGRVQAVDPAGLNGVTRRPPWS
jgi:NAD(P)-dependent dehydrogenase (short-subunit alcohol dehydrogenase family)